MNSPLTLEAHALYADLTGRGVVLSATPEGKLRYKPKSLLSTEELEKLREHKGEFLEFLNPAKEFPSSPLSPPSPPGETPHGNATKSGDSNGDRTAAPAVTMPDEEEVPEFILQRQREAEALGLVARWSPTFGFISIHDPTTGEWYDVPTKSAPQWAKDECFKRRELRKKRGIRHLLNRAELERIWAEEHAGQAELERDVIDESASAVTAKGIVYEDYLSGDE